MHTHSYKNLSLSFRSSNYYWKFLVANVTLPILSVDFLLHFHVLIDVAHRWLVNADSYLSTPLQSGPSDLTLYIRATTDAFAHLLSSYPEVLCPELRHTPMVPTKHGIYHHIKMMGTPVFTRFWRLSPDRLEATKRTFAEMEEMCLCQTASSPWWSPLDIDLKRDGCLRLCGDYKCLNMQTEMDHYHLPNIAYLHKAKVFSTLDPLKE
ncbi:uncharacterized protein [Palaemon carinicauda]|uniref:uncharacterized protein n=1 Tax=Palaemon carinicauda TaxID=392227 RepID=UPI0035B69872